MKKIKVTKIKLTSFWCAGCQKRIKGSPVETDNVQIGKEGELEYESYDFCADCVQERDLKEKEKNELQALQSKLTLLELRLQNLECFVGEKFKKKE